MKTLKEILALDPKEWSKFFREVMDNPKDYSCLKVQLHEYIYSLNLEDVYNLKIKGGCESKKILRCFYLSNMINDNSPDWCRTTYIAFSKAMALVGWCQGYCLLDYLGDYIDDVTEV